MARHPWVAAADNGVRFGVLVMGAQRFTEAGPGDGWAGAQMLDEPLQEMLATARVAEELGFDAVFVADAPRNFPDPLVSMTALALTTRRIWIGSAVLVPAFRPPALVARMTADIDRLSGGRVILGLGIGESAGQFGTIGATWGSASARQSALGEALDIVTGCWGAESFAYHGSYYQVEHMQVVPGPRQQPRPPILIGGSGDRTLAQVARHADACNLLDVTPEMVVERLAHLDRCCDAVGRPRNEVLRGCWDLLSIETPERAIAHYQGLIDAGIQYVIVAMEDTSDREMLHRLSTEVIPHLHPPSGMEP